MKKQKFQPENFFSDRMILIIELLLIIIAIVILGITTLSGQIAESGVIPLL